MASTPKTLATRIALTGGADIRRELEALGDDGKAAFKKLQQSAEQFKELRTIRQQLQQLRKDLGDLKDAAGEFAGAVKTVVARTTLLVGAVGGAIGGMAALAVSTAKAVDDQHNLATGLGLTIEEFTKLQFATQSLGLTNDNLRTGLGQLARTITQANDEATAGDNILRKLGIATRGAGGAARSTYEVLADLADKLRDTKTGADQVALAMKLLGAEAGPRFIPLLQQGRAGVEALAKEAERLGVVTTNAQAQEAAALASASDTLLSVVGSVKRDLVLLFTPTLVEGAKALTEAIARNREALVAFGESVKNKVVPFVKDLFALLSGKDADVQNRALITLRDTAIAAGAALIGLFNAVKFAFDVVADTLQPVLDVFNDLFGTNLQAKQVLVIALLGQVLGVFKLIGTAINLARAAFVVLSTLIGPAAAAIVSGFAAGVVAVNAIEKGIDALVALLTERLTAAVVGVWDLFKTRIAQVGQFFVDMGKTALAVIQRIAAAIANVPVIGSLVGGGNNQQPAQARAGGGSVRGPGTSRSDSILARLSNGEYVIQAAAVRKYGSTFLSALNSMRLPSHGFALGGLVEGFGAALAGPAPTGQPVLAAARSSASRPLNLSIGGEVFGGLLAPEDVAERLARFATSRAIRRTGRMPSWNRGG